MADEKTTGAGQRRRAKSRFNESQRDSWQKLVTWAMEQTQLTTAMRLNLILLANNFGGWQVLNGGFFVQFSLLHKQVTVAERTFNNYLSRLCKVGALEMIQKAHNQYGRTWYRLAFEHAAEAGQLGLDMGGGLLVGLDAEVVSVIEAQIASCGGQMVGARVVRMEDGVASVATAERPVAVEVPAAVGAAVSWAVDDAPVYDAPDVVAVAEVVTEEVSSEITDMSPIADVVESKGRGFSEGERLKVAEHRLGLAQQEIERLKRGLAKQGGDVDEVGDLGPCEVVNELLLMAGAKLLDDIQRIRLDGRYNLFMLAHRSKVQFYKSFVVHAFGEAGRKADGSVSYMLEVLFRILDDGEIRKGDALPGMMGAVASSQRRGSLGKSGERRGGGLAGERNHRDRRI